MTLVLGVFVPREIYSSKTGPERPVPARQTETPVGWCSASDDQVSNLKGEKKVRKFRWGSARISSSVVSIKGTVCNKWKNVPSKRGESPYL